MICIKNGKKEISDPIESFNKEVGCSGKKEMEKDCWVRLNKEMRINSRNRLLLIVRILSIGIENNIRS